MNGLMQNKPQTRFNKRQQAHFVHVQYITGLSHSGSFEGVNMTFGKIQVFIDKNTDIFTSYR